MRVEAFEAKKNVYFNYEFSPIDVDEDFPDMIQRSFVGLLFKHAIYASDVTYCIYYEEELCGEELQKMQADWARYCPV